MQIITGINFTYLITPGLDYIGTQIDPATYVGNLYMRSATAGLGLTLTGTNENGAYRFTADATATGALTPGKYTYQIIAKKSGDASMVESGEIQVVAGATYTGTPAAFDNRSQNQIDLDAVQACIRAIINGGAVSEYTVAGRSLKRMPMTELLQLESRLKAAVTREIVRNGGSVNRTLKIKFQ